MADFTVVKPLDTILSEAKEEGAHTLRKSLGALNLITLGIGAIIGAGIFVLTGTAAANNAGPAVVLSFVLAAVACAFAGLCYAEFASSIPIAGSAYTYGYATLGEIFAWIIGWDLVLEYAFGAATVASGWSGYVVSFLSDYGIHIPMHWASARGTELVELNGIWVTKASVDPALAATLPQSAGYFNIVAFIAVMLVTVILIIGIKESANFNSAVVIVKVAVVILFIIVAAAWVLRNPEQASANLTPFLPDNQGKFGAYGWSGIAQGAAVIFFAYIGFDAVSTAAQEAKRPQRDMPLGILGSLVICTVLYILVAGLLTAVVPFRQLGVGDPLAVAIGATQTDWAKPIIKGGAIFGLATVMLVMLLGQSRVFYSMSRDGLLWPWASAIHPRFRTPWITSLVVGFVVAIFAALVPIADLGHMVSIGTLFAFVIVCAGVWIMRKRQPNMERPFKTPWVPFVPIMGILVSFSMMASLPLVTWERLLIWLGIGNLIYFSYGVFQSRVRRANGGFVMPAGNSTANVLGYLGAAMIAAGLLAPKFTLANGLSFNYFPDAVGLGLVVVAIVLNALMFILRHVYGGVAITGGMALLVLSYTYWQVSQGEGVQSVQWGFFVSLTGAILLLAAYFVGRKNGAETR